MRPEIFVFAIFVGGLMQIFLRCADSIRSKVGEIFTSLIFSAILLAINALLITYFVLTLGIGVKVGVLLASLLTLVVAGFSCMLLYLRDREKAV